jgi:hypothetical protein
MLRPSEAEFGQLARPEDERDHQDDDQPGMLRN